MIYFTNQKIVDLIKYVFSSTINKTVLSSSWTDLNSFDYNGLGYQWIKFFKKTSNNVQQSTIILNLYRESD